MKRNTLLTAVMAGILALCCIATTAHALDPADNGIWSNPDTRLQGFVVQYAPVLPPALVFYWFTYDEDGNQAWFISENVDLTSTASEQQVKIYKPMGFFVSDQAQMGAAVGILALSSSGPRISVRFGIAPIQGFSDGCAAGLPQRPRPSPLPPPISRDLYPCQSDIFLARITPVIAALE